MKMSSNTFLRNIGVFSETAGAISISCYANITDSASNNYDDQAGIFEFDGFKEGIISDGEEDLLFNNIINRDQYKARCLGTFTLLPH